MKPIVHGLEPKFAGKITFINVDVDTDQGQQIIAYLHSDGGIPAFFFIKKGGKQGENMVGATSSAQLETHLNALLQ